MEMSVNIEFNSMENTIVFNIMCRCINKKKNKRLSINKIWNQEEWLVTYYVQNIDKNRY